jgi:hypothetical protein
LDDAVISSSDGRIDVTNPERQPGAPLEQEPVYFPTKEQKETFRKVRSLLYALDTLEKNVSPSHICRPQMEKRRVTDIGGRHQRHRTELRKEKPFIFSHVLCKFINADRSLYYQRVTL